MANAVQPFDCIVVGAGMAGLLAARTLRDAGRSVVVLEELPAVGGRVATRRLDGHVLDEGAQFFTVRSPRFRALADGWLREAAAQEWSRGFADAEGELAEDGHPRLRGAGGMDALPKAISRDLDVRLGVRVVGVAVRESAWEVHTEGERRYAGRALLLTPPAPQALALLDGGGDALPVEAAEQLAALEYDPCITLLATLDGPSAVPPPGGQQVRGEPIDWLADNHAKGISPHTSSVTIHSGPAFAREHWEAPDEAIARALLDAAGGRVCSRVRRTAVRRWRYSQPREPHPEPCLVARREPPLVFAGDAFGDPKVEGACLSGLAAAAQLAQLLA